MFFFLNKKKEISIQHQIFFQFFQHLRQWDRKLPYWEGSINLIPTQFQKKKRACWRGSAFIWKQTLRINSNVTAQFSKASAVCHERLGSRCTDEDATFHFLRKKKRRGISKPVCFASGKPAHFKSQSFCEKDVVIACQNIPGCNG